MRPVRLDLDGFASFREPTTLDLAGVDHFALVGPTGSGKSTLIDAVVFALYGTAPRWGRRNAIEYALAPTAARATVRLVFDLAGHRYVVAREVRRIGRTITQRTTSLERLLDPDDLCGPSEVLADTPSGITSAVQSLIGLSYEDFTQCVVLPQGQFADFLRAKNADRQDILLTLLGAHRYETIRRSAAARAAAARSAADTLTAQLAGYADADQGAIDAADHRVHALAAGTGALTGLAQRWAATDRRTQETGAALARARADIDALVAVQVPQDLTGLQATAARTAHARTTTEARAAGAATAHRQARDALDRAPDPGPLTARRHQWEHRAQLLDSRPALQAARTQAEQHHATAQQRLTDATAAAERADHQHRTAREHLDVLLGQEAELTRRRTTLGQVSVPAGLPALGQTLRAAQQQDTDARAALARATTAEDAAQTAAEAAPDTAGLRRAVTVASTLTELEGHLAASGTRLQTREEDLRVAQDRGRLARQRHEQAQRAWEQARTADLVATVRAGLTTGDDCPVCGGTVHDLPAPEQAAAPRRARQALDEAATALESARQHWDDRRTAAGDARAEHDRLTRALDRTRAELTELVPDGPTDPAGLQDLLTRATSAQDAARQARDRSRQARQDADAAATALQDAQHAQTAARAAYQQALATCLPLGLTPPDSPDVPAGWQHLQDWRATALDTLAADLAQHQRSVRAATDAADTARTHAAETTRAREQAHQELTRAQVAEGTARTRLTEVDTTLAGLDAALADGPDLDTVVAALAERHALATREQATYQQARSAAEDAAAARAAHQQATDALTRSRAELTRQTQTLAALHPPPVDTQDVAAGWAQLTTWAGQRRTDLQTGTVPGLEQDAAAAAADLAGLAAELNLLLADLDLPLTEPPDPHRAEVALADAAARAQGRAAALRERAGHRDRLQHQVAAATERATVAAHLADLLRANKFQGWLAGAALDTLVQGASDALRVLSGGQFDLTHDKGEFYIVDHADADSLRSVRTLSGGETFQASLALALTLSEHLGSLQTTATAPLESIFLDEGFGTLDADSLDVVAATLETLAESDRMVGIVTHVGALADRVPVRFTVTRDVQGSRVARHEEDR